MRIGLVLDSYDPRRGGVEQWTHQFALRLAARGHEVHVIAGGFGPAADSLGIIPHAVPPGGNRLDRARAAETILRGLDLDVIHDMGFGWYCDIFQPHGGSRRASFEQNLLLSPAWLRGPKRLLARVLPRYRQFDALTARQCTPGPGQFVLALSRMVERDLQRFHGVPADRIRRIYNGVDVQRFSPDHRAVHRQAVRERLGLRDEVLFLIVAHNPRLKGVPALLRAMGRLVALGHAVHLAVVGGKRTGWLERLARRAGCDRTVTLAGPVDDSVPWYAAADVYVQPTYYDPCSLVVLEALACGLPVITTRFNGAGELIAPGTQGFVTDDPADDAELARCMAWLLDGPTRRRAGEAARALALRHSFDENVNRVLAVYDEVLTAKRRTASAGAPAA